MDKSKAIELLKQCLDKVPQLRELHHDNQNYPLWFSKVRVILEDTFVGNSREYKVFSSSGSRAHIKLDLIPDSFYQNDYLTNLTSHETALKSIIQKYEILGVEEKPVTMAGLPPKAFIAHEGETKALDKLKAFLDALGVIYLIAEIEPSNGRLVEEQVDWSQGQADFAIILATKGKVVSKKTGKPQIGTNVADELGRARQVFKNRIILLRQTELEIHTNVSGIIREHFSPQSIDRAFIKIAKELRNWGFLTAGKVEESKTLD
ncbi:TIR domain-containing protein [Chloroflexota bacterium]